jgi:NarL family two-component system response regulator LiaR
MGNAGLRSHWGTGVAPHTRSILSRQVIIADDHPLFRSALRTVVSEASNLEVAAEAADGLEALELCRQLMPDIVLMDVHMPKMDGIESTRVIKRELPHTVVLMITVSADPQDLARALKAGAAGYVLKSVAPQQITDAVLRALEGESPLDQELAKDLLLRLMDEEHSTIRAEQQETQPPPQTAPSPASPLSSRELEVLRLVVRGQTNQQIAKNLLISVSTVKKSVQSIISKLRVSDRTQAAVRAIELGLYTGSQDE